MWFLKSRKALQRKLLSTLIKGRKTVKHWIIDYENYLSEEIMANMTSLLQQFDSMIKDSDENWKFYDRKQLYLFNKMFGLVLKAKKYELALMKSIGA